MSIYEPHENWDGARKHTHTTHHSQNAGENGVGGP